MGLPATLGDDKAVGTGMSRSLRGTGCPSGLPQDKKLLLTKVAESIALRAAPLPIQRLRCENTYANG
jgi:hypothetical protein